MVKNAIKIYGRIKPVVKRKDVGQYFIQEGSKEDTLFLQVRERDYHEDQHHKAELSQFKFYKVFDQHVRQHELFSSVAKPIVDSVLQGYNGTVFAYGQTGSGKTFTITGGPDDFEDRGLIPRAIEYVFRKIASADGSLYTVCVTYLQIYNEAAYDLLGHHQRMARLEDLPKLNLLDDTEGYLHIRNLSLHPVNSENEALNLLFLGDTNRAIAETPMNQASSRSHCMFTIHLAIRRTSWKNTRRAKLHFVDLAGSERLNKKGGRNPGTIDGRTINEARHINLSLHYLEQVITALAEAKRVHVPYRNCIITTMLRDSIGGNCLTSMVATLSLDHHHLPETLATCRFAQRVALVKNDATLNEDRDPVQEVSVLKTEVRRLKDQIRLLTNGKHYGDTHLTAAEETECRELIEAFLENSQPLELPTDLRKIEYCCLLLKEAVVEARKSNNIPRHEKGNQHVEKCMQKLLQQRNNEIGIIELNLLFLKLEYLCEACITLSTLDWKITNFASFSAPSFTRELKLGSHTMYRYAIFMERKRNCLPHHWLVERWCRLMQLQINGLSHYTFPPFAAFTTQFRQKNQQKWCFQMEWLGKRAGLMASPMT